MNVNVSQEFMYLALNLEFLELIVTGHLSL